MTATDISPDRFSVKARRAIHSQEHLQDEDIGGSRRSVGVAYGIVGARWRLFLAVLLKKNGKIEGHYQTLTHENCERLIAGFHEEAERGASIELTFRSPPEVTGKLLEGVCFLPDGSIGARFKAPDLPAA